jgi:hypothetical protein
MEIIPFGSVGACSNFDGCPVLKAAASNSTLKRRYNFRVDFGYKPMAFGEYLLQVLQMEEDGRSRDRILKTWGSEVTDGYGRATRYQLACGDAVFWVLQSATYGSDYLLECMNERYGRETILEAVDHVTAQIDEATTDPLRYAFNKPHPTRLTLLTIALVRSLSPGVAARQAVEEFRDTACMRLTPIIFPDNLQRVFDLEELAGVPKENIPVLMDPKSWDLNDLETVDAPRITNFDKACSEANDWYQRFVPEPDLRAHLVARYPVDEIIEASKSIEANAHCRGNPLVFALKLPFPLRLTIVMLAIHRWYDSGGENVDVSSDLPPKPPSPGHWGGRTPGYEEPLPPRTKDLDIGQRNV